MMVGRNRSFRNWSVYKTGILDGSVLMDQRWLRWANKLLAALKTRTVEEKIWNFDYPAASKMFDHSNRFSGLSGIDHVPDASHWGRHRASAQSLGLSLLVALVVGQWSSSIITSTFLGSAIVVHSQSWTQA